MEGVEEEQNDRTAYQTTTHNMGWRDTQMRGVRLPAQVTTDLVCLRGFRLGMSRAVGLVLPIHIRICVSVDLNLYKDSRG
jgi:hypothetical protein